MSRTSKHWTNEEETIIVETLRLYMERNLPFKDAYDHLPDYLPGRTSQTIRNRWSKHLSKQYPEIQATIKTNDWTAEEDRIMVETIEKMTSNGVPITDCFSHLETILPKRNFYGIRFRWYDQLKERTIENETNEEEIEMIKRSEEYDILMKQNNELKSQNISLRKENKYLEEDFRVLRKKYDELFKVFTQMKSVISNGEVAVAIETDEQQDVIKFFMEQNGNLLKVN